ncbi:glycosyltransferase family 39 protein [candidate division WOR-3 bacterium]|nr:glycosyltransferase family 39 protein [candidate division WOR-3 bacterium]
MKNKVYTENKRIFLLYSGIFLILTLLLFSPRLFVGGDNAQYIALAESIVSGKGYRTVYLPDEPPNTHFPPGFPLLLCLPYVIFGKNILIFKFVVFCISVGALYFLYAIARYLYEGKTKFIMAFFLSLPIIVVYSHRVLSEMPYLFFTLGALYFFYMAEEKNPVMYYLSFGMATFAVFIRTTGMILIISMAIMLLLKKRFKYLFILLIVFGIAYIPWHMRNAALSASDTYFDQLFARDVFDQSSGKIGAIDFIRRIGENFDVYAFGFIPKTLLPILQSKVLFGIAGGFFVGLILLGFTISSRKFSVLDIYLIGGVAIILSWPRIWASERFLLPILPIMVFYVFTALFWISRKVKFKYLMITVVGILILLNSFAMGRAARDMIRTNIHYFKGQKYAGYDAIWHQYFALLNWIKHNIPPGRVIMARKPEFVYLISGHKSVIIPHTADHYEMMDAILQCDYVIFDAFYDEKTQEHLLTPVIKREQNKFKLVGQTPEPTFFLLQVVK